ncbi:Putative FAD/NAD(P)-binding domain, FAD/NAD(P)-binding domain superfamily [Septoria linicola]|uniref:FAD/NAD(P)-binding domain, FAD/NAD(P)-binding domain superfamily n=1 Tax=Septoria linicola TaxID=215465 RepID=A0A9Q9EHC7_9PEZI|nr:putative FAD/NAD(P)-binding domain, FAD/NAD(P)-binding domain superfamily [Septoria linicola]USW50865.1 Putative FAD/NAD(P)-binding domain, FAD/NAD(P)-binding domain superfamily [Septoria linicola]
MASALKNVVVVGGSYVGLNAARELMSIIPQTHRVLLIEPHTHFNHIFTFPRFAILPGHEQKAFVPYTGVFPNSSRHKVIAARANQVHPKHVQISTAWEGSSNVPFDYLVLATGTRLAAPSMMPYDDDFSSVQYLQSYQDQLGRSQAITIVGGGAVGVQMALDLRELYPGKDVMVVHSRDQLMQVFHPKLHEIISAAFAEKDIRLITNTRAKVPQDGFPNNGDETFSVGLQNGQTINSNFVILATGQKPNNQLVASLPSSNASGLVNTANGFLHVKPSLQLQDDSYSNIFAVGDIADTGLHKAARPGAAQAKVVAKNILSLIEGQQAEAKFEKSPRAIHLSLGFKRNVIFRNPNEAEGQTEPTIIEKFDGREDMGVEGMWDRLNVPLTKPQVAEPEIRAEL